MRCDYIWSLTYLGDKLLPDYQKYVGVSVALPEGEDLSLPPLGSTCRGCVPACMNARTHAYVRTRKHGVRNMPVCARAYMHTYSMHMCTDVHAHLYFPLCFYCRNDT